MKEGYELVNKLLEKAFGKRGSKVVFCLVLMVFGVTHTEIQEKFGVALSTTRRYRAALKKGDISPLFVVTERVRQQSALDAFEEKIIDDFNDSPPKTLREAQTRIEELTGIKRSLHRLRVWLQKRGFAHGL